MTTMADVTDADRRRRMEDQEVKVGVGGDQLPLPTVFPIKGIGLRGYWARRDVCPECGGDLDTGWECIVCGFDAKPEAQPT